MPNTDPRPSACSGLRAVPGPGTWDMGHGLGAARVVDATALRCAAALPPPLLGSSEGKGERETARPVIGWEGGRCWASALQQQRPRQRQRQRGKRYGQRTIVLSVLTIMALRAIGDRMCIERLLLQYRQTTSAAQSSPAQLTSIPSHPIPVHTVRDIQSCPALPCPAPQLRARFSPASRRPAGGAAAREFYWRRRQAAQRRGGRGLKILSVALPLWISSPARRPRRPRLPPALRPSGALDVVGSRTPAHARPCHPALGSLPAPCCPALPALPWVSERQREGRGCPSNGDAPAAAAPSRRALLPDHTAWAGRSALHSSSPSRR